VTSERLVVPVTDSATVRQAVAHAVRLALDNAAETGERAAVHFVYPLAKRPRFDVADEGVERARDLLERATVWAQEDVGDDDAPSLDVETAVIGADQYLFGPDDYADVIVRYAREHDLGLAVFDPNFDPLGTTPLLPSLENEVRRTGLEVVEAPVTRERRGTRLVRRGTAAQFLTLFGVSFGFYLLLAGSFAPFELATGAISAGVVAFALWGISLTTPVEPGRTVLRLLRFVLYVPYLLWEIVKANVSIAYVVLHPKLPIDPELVEFDAAVWSALPVTTLANSITLTPGTLTVDVSRQHFTVHTLTESSRKDLFDGGLERAVRFVFYGRAAARIPTPAERLEEDES
jgi:multicomponent Na+:H+ antiporter subunit E